MLIMGCVCLCVCVCVCQCVSIIFSTFPWFTLLQFLFLCPHLYYLSPEALVMHHRCYCFTPFCFHFSSLLSLFLYLCAPSVYLFFYFLWISCFWFCYAWIRLAFPPTFKHEASLTVSAGHYPHIQLWKTPISDTSLLLNSSAILSLCFVFTCLSLSLLRY